MYDSVNDKVVRLNIQLFVAERLDDFVDLFAYFFDGVERQHLRQEGEAPRRCVALGAVVLELYLNPRLARSFDNSTGLMLTVDDSPGALADQIKGWWFARTEQVISIFEGEEPGTWCVLWPQWTFGNGLTLSRA